MFGSLENANYAAKRDFYDLEDIIQVGMLGLFHATKRFDQSKNYKFSTLENNKKKRGRKK